MDFTPNDQLLLQGYNKPDPLISTKRGKITFSSIAKTGLTAGAIYFGLMSLSSFDDSLSFSQKLDEYYEKNLGRSVSDPTIEQATYKSNWQRAKENFGRIIAGAFAAADVVFGTNSAGTVAPFLAGIIREDNKSVQVTQAELMGKDSAEGLATTRDLRARYGNNGGFNPNLQRQASPPTNSTAQQAIISASKSGDTRVDLMEENLKQLEVVPGKANPTVPASITSQTTLSAATSSSTPTQATAADNRSTVKQNMTAPNKPQQTSESTPSKTGVAALDNRGNSADDLMKL